MEKIRVSSGAFETNISSANNNDKRLLGKAKRFILAEEVGNLSQ